MVDGVNGVCGMSVQLLVVEGTKEELVHVTVLCLNSMDMSVLLMVPLRHKHKDAMRMHAQVCVTVFSYENFQNTAQFIF